MEEHGRIGSAYTAPATLEYPALDGFHPPQPTSGLPYFTPGPRPGLSQGDSFAARLREGQYDAIRYDYDADSPRVLSDGDPTVEGPRDRLGQAGAENDRNDPQYLSENMSSGADDESEDDDEDDEDTGSDSSDAIQELLQFQVKRGAPSTRGRGRGVRGGRAAYNLQPHRLSRPDGLLDDPSMFRPYAGRGRPRARRPRGRARGRKRGPQAVEPSLEFKDVQNKAYNSFLLGNYDEALGYAKQAVQINPEIFQAHSLLSEIYLQKNMLQESVGVLWSGAHTRRDASIWWEVAQRTEALGGDDKDAMLNQLMYCYSQILKIDPRNFDAKKAKMNLYLEHGIGFRARAARECGSALEQHPYDLELLQLYAELCIYTGEASKALKTYEEAVTLFRQHGNRLHDFEFSFSDLNVYLELFEHLGQWTLGITQLKSVARWLCGRQNELIWTRWTFDDREWDLEDAPRRTELPTFKPGQYPEGSYGEMLPPEIRAKLGLFRVRKGPMDFAEALRHFRFFGPDGEFTANEYPDILRDIITGLHDTAHDLEAIHYFEHLERSQTPFDRQLRSKAARSYQRLQKYDQAISQWERAIEEEPGNRYFRARLSDLLGHLGRLDKLKQQYRPLPEPSTPERTATGKTPENRPSIALAPFLSREVPPAADGYPRAAESPYSQAATTPTPSQPTPEDTPGSASRTPDMEVARQQSSRALNQPSLLNTDKKGGSGEYHPMIVCSAVVLSYHRMRELRQAMKDEDEQAMLEWCRAAHDFFAEYKKVEILFKIEERRSRDEREAKVAQAAAVLLNELHHPDSNLKEAAAGKFRQLSLRDLLDVFCEYSFVCAKRGDGETANEVLQEAEAAEIFTGDEECEFHIHVCWATCALILGDGERLCVVGRWFIRAYPFATDMFRFYTALNRVYQGDDSCFARQANQKFMMRQIKSMDFALLTPEQRKLFNFAPYDGFKDHAGVKSSNATPDNPLGLQSHDAVLLAMYGHMLSESPALQYQLRAYAASERRSAMAALSIAIEYLDMTQKRQTGERHYFAMLGMAFMAEYRRLRLSPDAEDVALGPTGEVADGDTAEYRRVARRTQLTRAMEVEFNEGRMWHFLGLAHLAVPAYQRCLDVDTSTPPDDQSSGEDRQDTHMADATVSEGDEEPGRADDGHEQEDFKREAAFALQHILALGGDSSGARAVAEKWLVY